LKYIPLYQIVSKRGGDERLLNRLPSRSVFDRCVNQSTLYKAY
jgi:hypothetical protein